MGLFHPQSIVRITYLNLTEMLTEKRIMNDVIKKVRGKGVKPTRVYISIRIDEEVHEFFNTYPNRSAKIREVLANFINKERGIKDEKTKQAVTETN
jgi:uncharacterized protein (DUF4415 family)